MSVYRRIPDVAQRGREGRFTDEDWQPLPKNTILALSQGEVVATHGGT